MKFKVIGILIFLIPLGCQYNRQPDCICTQQFNIITVEIVDSLNRPLGQLQTRTVSSSGETIIPLQKKIDFLLNEYVIADDSNLKSFSSLPTPVMFIVSDSVKVKTFQYFLKTDECQCHIHKVSGSDKIIF